MALTQNLIKWLILTYLLCLVLLSRGQRMCCDSECKQPISWGITNAEFTTRDDGFLSYFKWEFITIFSKNVEVKEIVMWGAEVRGKRGVITPAAVDEVYSYCQPIDVGSPQVDISKNFTSDNDNFEDITLSSSIEAENVMENTDKENDDSLKERVGTEFADEVIHLNNNSYYEHSDFENLSSPFGLDNDNGGNGNSVFDGDKEQQSSTTGEIYFTPEYEKVKDKTDNEYNNDKLSDLEVCDGYEKHKCQEKLDQVKDSLLLWLKELGGSEGHTNEDSKRIVKYGTQKTSHDDNEKEIVVDLLTKESETKEKRISGKRHGQLNSDANIHDKGNNEVIKQEKMISKMLLDKNLKLDKFNNNRQDIQMAYNKSDTSEINSNVNSSEMSSNDSKTTNKKEAYKQNSQNNEVVSINYGEKVHNSYLVAHNTTFVNYNHSVKNGNNNNSVWSNKISKTPSKDSGKLTKAYQGGGSSNHVKQVGKSRSNSQRHYMALKLLKKININKNITKSVNTDNDKKVLTNTSNKNTINWSREIFLNYCKEHYITQPVTENQEIFDLNINQRNNVSKLLTHWMSGKELSLDVVILVCVIFMITFLIPFGIIVKSYQKALLELKKERVDHLQAVCSFSQQKHELQEQIHQMSGTLQQSKVSVDKYSLECDQFKHQLSQLELQNSALTSEKEKILEENKLLVQQVQKILEENKLHDESYRKHTMKDPNFRTSSRSYTAPNALSGGVYQGPLPQCTTGYQQWNYVNQNGYFRGVSYYPPRPQVAIDMSEYEHLYQPPVGVPNVPKFEGETGVEILPLNIKSQCSQASPHFI